MPKADSDSPCPFENRRPAPDPPQRDVSAPPIKTLSYDPLWLETLRRIRLIILSDIERISFLFALPRMPTIYIMVWNEAVFPRPDWTDLPSADFFERAGGSPFIEKFSPHRPHFPYRGPDNVPHLLFTAGQTNSQVSPTVEFRVCPHVFHAG